MDWPGSNDLYSEVMRGRDRGKGLFYNLFPLEDREISRYLKPREDEFVVASYEELRFVLEMQRIKVLIYGGKGLNACMLTRPTGINSFALSDRRKALFVIIVLEDCSFASGSPAVNSEATKQVMLDYLMNNGVFASDSKRIRLDRPRN
jgi:hypothetical protein